MKANKKQIKQIVNDLILYKPEKIILFGSYARGEQNKYSDIDLLIIKKTKKRVNDRLNDCLGFIYKKSKLLTDRFELDIIPKVLTPKELEDRQEHDFFIKEVLKEGKVLYAK